MRIEPISYTPSATSQKINFKQKYNPLSTLPEYNRAFKELDDLNLQTWQKRINITTFFDNLINTVQHSEVFKKTEGFQKLYESYKANGLRGMLYALGQANSDSLKGITKNYKPYSEETILASTLDGKKYISIENKGQFGLFNSLFNRKTKNEVIIGFTTKDPNYSYIKFSLDKKDNYRVANHNHTYENTVLYYAHKDGIKEVELPKTDLYLPPGL